MVKPNNSHIQEKKLTLSDYYEALPIHERRPTVNRISEACDVSEATVYNWISGRNRPLKGTYFIQLSELTGIPKDDLFAD